MILPLGEMTKTRIREIATEKGFMKAATKKDSLGVCFCPMDYRTFLKNNVTPEKIRPGIFCDEAGNRIGMHEGYPFYTIGQRRGLGIHMNKAIFVKEIIPDENKVIISDNIKNLEQKEMWLTDWNIINPDILLGMDDVIIKIRYRKQANRCRVEKTKDGLLHVILHEPLASIAPGQAAAFYRENMVLGGGIIK